MVDWSRYEPLADEVIAKLKTGGFALRAPARNEEKWRVHHAGRFAEIIWQGDYISESLFVGDRVRWDVMSSLRYDAEELPVRIAQDQTSREKLKWPSMTEAERDAMRTFRLIEIPEEKREEIYQKTDPARYPELLPQTTITIRWGIGSSYRSYGPTQTPEEHSQQSDAMREHFAFIAPMPCRVTFYQKR